MNVKESIRVLSQYSENGFEDETEKVIVSEIVALLKKQEPKSYRFSYTAETIIGMNEETGELNTFDVYKCPTCGMEVTYTMAKNWHWCPECGQVVKWEQMSYE